MIPDTRFGARLPNLLRSMVLAFAWLGSTAGSGAEKKDQMDANQIVARIEASRLEPEIGAILELERIPPSGMVADDTRTDPADAPPFALDGSGGTFRVLADGRILLIDSEGSFGVVGQDFPEFVGIVTGLPGWRNALRFVGDPDPAQARARWEAYVRQWRLDAASDGPWPYASDSFSVTTLAEARAAIRAAFGAAALPDPFGSLHRAVNTLSRDVSVSQAGAPLLLFGREPCPSGPSNSTVPNHPPADRRPMTR